MTTSITTPARKRRSRMGVSKLAFGLKDPRDFLEKARHELDRLDDLSEQKWFVAPGAVDDEHGTADAAINTAITLWHITDWTAHSSDPRAVAIIDHAAQVLGGARKTTYKTLRDFVLTDPDIAICHDLANGAKHVELSSPAVPASTVYGLPEELQGVTSAPPGGDTVRVAKVIMPDGARVPAIEIFDRALAYWEALFTQYGM